MNIITDTFDRLGEYSHRLRFRENDHKIRGAFMPKKNVYI